MLFVVGCVVFCRFAYGLLSFDVVVFVRVRGGGLNELNNRVCFLGCWRDDSFKC